MLCEACGAPLRTRTDLPPGSPIGLPATLPLPLAQLEWCAAFTGPVRQALHQLKYSGERRLAGPLGAAMAARWRVAGVGGDLMVPVPIHAERARRRGYDQAELLAREAAARLGLPCVPALERVRNTAPQFDLGRGLRQTTVRGAFGIRLGMRPLGARRWVIDVDDVATTGATLVACAEALYATGASAVSGLTGARER